MKRAVLAGLCALLAALPAAAAVPTPPTSLFDDLGPLRLTIRGPIDAIRRSGERSEETRNATLAVGAAAETGGETHAIALSPRGITRRRRDVCSFPPLRIDFVTLPAIPLLFARQSNLKLVTHCRPEASFQQHVLLEYAAYRMLLRITPVALKVRLAEIDYIEPGASRPFVTRYGYLIEDGDHAARRLGLVELETGNVIASRLAPEYAARFAMFQYMIGNLDWSMNAGPPGKECCHNSRLFAPAATSVRGLIPVPYDFDHSGLVDAPYATPPPQVPVNSVRDRHYRGHCAHNGEVPALARLMRVEKAALLGVLADIPGLAPRARSRAESYLEGFFRDIATEESVRAKLLRTCLR